MSETVPAAPLGRRTKNGASSTATAVAARPSAWTRPVREPRRTEVGSHGLVHRRLFVVRGTNDLSTAQQFRWSRVVYGVATALSIAYLAVFLAGVAIAFRRRSALLLFLVPIVYVPVTICFVLTNMRYTVTVQPLMFVFVAVAVLAGMRLLPDERRLSAGAS